ncbi:hypothetical protein HDA32_004624 [Spinactinospora alkalitolerans]|uniref:DUF2933 domain-containing protein n=1 Tax=Spinactinospora alkalitolerans TaxID=687207 RepID=A0A852U600_9ACTN|nr:hypothetical protein [Spinactinospora alkalitolerans]NYE49504.1 hypothetical protein [Spinactinospora alkalitolerans]
MEALYLLALLACPLGMGAMMWMMMRRPGSTSTPADSRLPEQERELARLRAEIQTLRTQSRSDTAPRMDQP